MRFVVSVSVLLLLGSGGSGQFLGAFVENMKKIQSRTMAMMPDNRTFPMTMHKNVINETGNGSRGQGGGEISGFLGIENLMNPIISLKKSTADSPIPEPDCVRTYYMGPFAKTVTFFANGSVGNRVDPTCDWSFIGTEPCVPIINCPHFNLNDTEGKCEEWVELTDGFKGYQKFCGSVGPMNLSALGGLRDLYLRYRAVKRDGRVDPEMDRLIKFSCTVACSNRGNGTALEKTREPKVNPMCLCGNKVNQNRIVNGVESEKGEFPWIVAIVRAGTRQPFCGGTLINDRMIITAAHCIKGSFMQVKNLEVILGAHILDEQPNMGVVKGPKPMPIKYNATFLAELDKGNGSIRRQLDEIVVHPLYVTETNDYDVALLRLSVPIDFSNHTQLSPACLPKLGSYLRTYALRMAIVAGWGLSAANASGTTTRLQKLPITVFAPKVCKEFYAHRVNRRMLCAGYEDGTHDSCMGDSGGPLMTEDRPQVWYLIGTVSWGEGCATSKNPGVYIRTTEVGQWAHYHSNSNDALWCTVPQIKKKA